MSWAFPKRPKKHPRNIELGSYGRLLGLGKRIIQGSHREHQQLDVPSATAKTSPRCLAKQVIWACLNLAAPINILTQSAPMVTAGTLCAQFMSSCCQKSCSSAPLLNTLFFVPTVTVPTRLRQVTQFFDLWDCRICSSRYLVLFWIISALPSHCWPN